MDHGAEIHKPMEVYCTWKDRPNLPFGRNRPTKQHGENVRFQLRRRQQRPKEPVGWVTEKIRRLPSGTLRENSDDEWRPFSLRFRTTVAAAADFKDKRWPYPQADLCHVAQQFGKGGVINLPGQGQRGRILQKLVVCIKSQKFLSFFRRFSCYISVRCVHCSSFQHTRPSIN